MNAGAGRLRSMSVAAALALLLAACVTPVSQWRTAPAPCTDQIYGQLKEQQPDSLTAREWQRLQSLDRECTAARTAAAHERSGWTHGATLAPAS